MQCILVYLLEFGSTLEPQAGCGRFVATIVSGLAHACQESGKCFRERTFAGEESSLQVRACLFYPTAISRTKTDKVKISLILNAASFKLPVPCQIRTRP